MSLPQLMHLQPQTQQALHSLLSWPQPGDDIQSTEYPAPIKEAVLQLALEINIIKQTLSSK